MGIFSRVANEFPACAGRNAEDSVPYEWLVCGKLAGQAPGGGAGNFQILVGADQAFAAMEAHQPSALGAGGEEVFVHAVHQTAEGSAHIGLVDLLGDPVLQSETPFLYQHLQISLL